MFSLFSPLEQFQILPIIPIRLGIFDFSVTNATIILAFGLFTFIFVLFSLLSKGGDFYVVPNRIQYIVEVIYSVVYGLLNDNVGPVAKSFFPYIFTLFTFILITNVIGLVPYSFTVTSHLIVTFSLALATFIAINLICIREHGINILALFFTARIFNVSCSFTGSY